MTVPTNFVAPSLPVSLPTFDQSLEERFRNVLRLYFNQIDNQNRTSNEQVATNQTMIWLDM
jgi:hypothetical protein